MATVSLDDPNLAEELKKLLASDVGEIVFTQGAMVIKTVLHPVDNGASTVAVTGKRPLGLWKGKIEPFWMAPDFDDELPDSFWLGEEE